MKDTLALLGFNAPFVNLLMGCVTSTTMSVSWNNSSSPTFSPSRGIRQGDPISPYLFVLCMERLGHLIQSKVDDGSWIPLTLRKDGPKLSHLFFADDLLLFCEVSLDQVEVVKEAMRVFCRGSGHRINLQKSKVLASKRVHFNRAYNLSLRLGIGLTMDLGKYLGVPLLHKRAVKLTFAPIVQKVHNKLASWKGKFVSKAGRVVMIKFVLSAIPLNQMQTLLLPQGTINAIRR